MDHQERDRAEAFERRRAELARRPLTSAALIKLEYIPVPEPLAPFITTFFHFTCDEQLISDLRPASAGLLIFFLRGHGELFVRDGTIDASHPASLVTPLSAAAPILVDGPWHVFGAAISPLGWGALTAGLSAAEHANRLLDAGSVIDPSLTKFAHDLAARYNATGDTPGLSGDEMAELASAVLQPLLRPVPAAHVRLIGIVAEWLGGALSPMVEDLASRSPYSPRQLQRLVDQYFGLPPKQLARKYRALRAAALLGHPDTPPDQIAAVEEQFYDQSHMIRELRLFAGRTPARLGAPDAPVLSALLDLRNFQEVSPSFAALPDGFGA
ncbi:helix-turn-helix transcriptional regulator [Novosphingobium olei]|uniref:Helix-turn-helix domain-containing protein n=1 Tax=Novosphingobium olei TaxID=2728851 RepID=A0A7Y0BSR5_9SPHN|nr:helix-turn-helix domain-containing protein [Novosphingobium olei]NML95778.1 helix-turn-helix domain-containing protein [Novosphingobium olei]BEV02171.1 helix-turn-helix domain-containing protein [Novosphingobium olei]